MLFNRTAGASFQLFLGGQIFLYFSMPPDYWKIGKNSTLYVVIFTLLAYSSLLNSQLYLSAMISSLLVILASSSILTCHSQIKLTPCLSLVIFISETSVVFVISFLFLQLQRLPIHSSPANLIIAIHSTMAFRKLTWTKYDGPLKWRPCGTVVPILLFHIDISP